MPEVLSVELELRIEKGDLFCRDIGMGCFYLKYKALVLKSREPLRGEGNYWFRIDGKRDSEKYSDFKWRKYGVK